MSTTTFAPYSNETFDRTLTELKSGAAAAIQNHTAATETAVKSAKDLAAFGQGTLQAIVEANKIFAAGAQDLVRQLTEAGQSAYAETTAGAQAVTTAKTPQAMLDAQAGLVRATFERSVTEGSRFARVGFDLAEKTAAPVLARFVLAAETFAPKA